MQLLWLIKYSANAVKGIENQIAPPPPPRESKRCARLWQCFAMLFSLGLLFSYSAQANSLFWESLINVAETASGAGGIHKLEKTSGVVDGYNTNAISIKKAISGDVVFNFAIDQTSSNIRVGLASSDGGATSAVGKGFFFGMGTAPATLRRVGFSVGDISNPEAFTTAQTYVANEKFSLRIMGEYILFIRVSAAGVRSEIGRFKHGYTVRDYPLFVDTAINEEGGSISSPTLSIAPTITQPTTPTTSDTITISGTTSQPDAVVTLTQNAMTFTVTAVGGVWSLPVTLVEGKNTFTATAIDGGVSLTSAPITVVPVVLGTTATQLHEEILTQLAVANVANVATSIGSRVDTAFSTVFATANYQFDGQTVQLDGQSRLSANLRDTLQSKLPTYANALKEGSMSWEQMMGDSSFVLPLNVADGDGSDSDSGSPGRGLTVWGSGDYRRLDGDGDIDWDGSLSSVQLGVDKRIRDNLLVGGLVSRSRGDIDYTQAGSKGDYKHKMTSVHPYLAWSNKGINFWGSAGYGRGKLDISNAGTKTISDTRMLSLSAGAKGQLPQMEGLSLKSDVSLARTKIKATAETVKSQQLRLILELERERALASGTLKPTVEIGARYDGGDGDSGLGAVFGAGVRYANTAGLTVEGKVHVLAGRKDYKEWGVSGVIRQQTGVGGRGLAFSLRPSYGKTGNNANQVWDQKLPVGDGGNSADDSAKLNINIGYGLSAPRGGLLTPYSEITLGNVKNYHLGLRWNPDSPFTLHLFGERTEGNGANSNRVLLESRIRF